MVGWLLARHHFELLLEHGTPEFRIGLGPVRGIIQEIEQDSERRLLAAFHALTGSVGSHLQLSFLQRKDQILFRREVLVKRPLRDIGSHRDVINRGGFIALRLK